MSRRGSPGWCAPIDFHSGQGKKIAGRYHPVQLNADSDIAQQQPWRRRQTWRPYVQRAPQSSPGAGPSVRRSWTATLGPKKQKRAQGPRKPPRAKKTLRCALCRAAGHHHLNPGQVPHPGEQGRHAAAAGSDTGDFRLPQHSLARITVGQKKIGALRPTLGPGLVPPAHHLLNPQVDSATRMFRWSLGRQSLAEALPGMFGHLQVAAGSLVHALTLPQSAVTYNPYGATVFLSSRTPPTRVARPSSRTSLPWVTRAATRCRH